MHFRRLACFLLGAWIGGSLFMAFVATQNFRSVDRLLVAPSPSAAQHIQVLGHDAARTFLRYQVSEQNRWYFETWEGFQLGLGLALFFLLLFGTDTGKIPLLLSLLMIVSVGVARFYLTPQIVHLGRLIDFVPADTGSPERSQFWTLHTEYSVLELVKWGLGFSLAAKLILRSRRKPGQAALKSADLPGALKLT